MPEVPDVAYFELAPDWLCEVLSPSTAKRDRTRKMHHYARAVPFDAIELELGALWAP
jgi:Uma2 family endonuclease